MDTRSEIAVSIESISNVKNQRTLVNQSINIALNRVYESHDFPYYLNEKSIETVDNYNTGTVEVTNGSKTVDGTDTVWTAAMVGRKFRVQNERAYYKIAAFVSGTEITLEENYQGEDNSGLTYEIYKDEYRLAADVDKYKLIRQLENGTPLFSAHPALFDSTYPTPENMGNPYIETMIGTKLDTYTTGTVTATVNTNTITGSATALFTSVEGLGRTSKLRIGNNVYTVKSVDSATSITTYEVIVATATDSTYEVTLNNLVVQLYDIPDAQRLLYYRFFRKPAMLANDYDIPDMPHGWIWLLMYGGLSIVLMQKGDVNKAQQEAEARFLQGLGQMKLKLGSFTPDRTYHRKSGDGMKGMNLDGLETPNFSRSVSMPR